MKKIILLSFLFALAAQAEIQKVSISKQIEIDIDAKELFNFVSNPLNDHKWRSEVNEITTSDQIREGAVFREDAFIGLRRHFITDTKLVQLSSPHIAVFEATEENPYFLRSTRMVVKSGDKYIFKYLVEFDKKMIKKVFGLHLSPALVRQAYGLKMQKYLLNLKRDLTKKVEF